MACYTDSPSFLTFYLQISMQSQYLASLTSTLRTHEEENAVLSSNSFISEISTEAFCDSFFCHCRFFGHGESFQREVLATDWVR
jgi:hypothetical protein